MGGERIERRLHQFPAGARKLSPGFYVFSAGSSARSVARSGQKSGSLPPLAYSNTPSLHHSVSVQFRDRLVLDREIDRIRDIAKFVGPLVERFG
jgi:hypothetical protein